MSKIAVLVTIHKPYVLPLLPIAYQPVQVGFFSDIDPKIPRDNTGENIAEKNSTFCELTALYWAWKNMEADVLGLCHYRRYFGTPGLLIFQIRNTKKDRFLSGLQIETTLSEYDIILPKKRHYWIETRESQYAHAHHIEDLRVAERILQEKHPEYIPAWEHMLNSRSGHICNMFIMRRELADEYCAWLFDTLFEVERRLDISSYSENDKRVFGFLGERLLDVWIETKGLRYVEVPMINMERQHWLRKGGAFILRKMSIKKNPIS